MIDGFSRGRSNPSDAASRLPWEERDRRVYNVLFALLYIRKHDTVVNYIKHKKSLCSALNRQKYKQV